MKFLDISIFVKDKNYLLSVEKNKKVKIFNLSVKNEFTSTNGKYQVIYKLMNIGCYWTKYKISKETIW